MVILIYIFIYVMGIVKFLCNYVNIVCFFKIISYLYVIMESYKCIFLNIIDYFFINN